MKILLLFFICLTEIYAQKLTFNAGLNKLLEESKTLQIKSIEKETSELRSKKSFSAFFPKLNLTSTNGIKSNIPSDQDTRAEKPFVSGLNLTLSANLYNNGNDLLEFNKKEKEKKLAIKEWENLRNEEILKYIDLYLKYSYQYELVKIQKSQLALLTKQHNQIKESYEKGLKPYRTFLRIKTDHMRETYSSKEFDRNLEDIKKDLKLQLGIAQNENWDIIPLGINKSLIAKFPDMKKSEQDDGLRNEITNLKSNVNDYQVKLLERKTGPELTLNSGVDYNVNNYIKKAYPLNKLDKTEWNVLLALKINLWDNFESSYERKIIYADRNKFIKEQEQGNNEYELKKQKIYSKMEQAKTNFEMNEKLLELENENFDAIEKEFYSGKSSYLDYTAALKDLQKTKSSYSQTYFDLIDSISNYYFYKGKIYEFVQGI